MESLLVDFCRAREAVLRAERATKEDRREQNDAARVLGGRLGESMMRHAVRCVAVDAAASTAGQARYVRLVQPARRACALKTADDCLALIRDVARHVTDVPQEHLPIAVAKLVHARARERGPDPPPPRISVVSKASRTPTTDVVLAPRETKTLVDQFLEVHAERAATRDTLTPLRAERKRCEAALAPLLDRDVSVAMRAPGEAPQTFSVSRATPTPRRRTAFGIRMLLPLVREVTEEAAKDRIHLDERLHALLATRLTGTAPPPPPPPSVARLKVRRLKAAAAPTTATVVAP